MLGVLFIRKLQLRKGGRTCHSTVRNGRSKSQSKCCTDGLHTDVECHSQTEICSTPPAPFGQVGADSASTGGVTRRLQSGKKHSIFLTNFVG